MGTVHELVPGIVRPTAEQQKNTCNMQLIDLLTGYLEAALNGDVIEGVMCLKSGKGTLEWAHTALTNSREMVGYLEYVKDRISRNE